MGVQGDADPGRRRALHQDVDEPGRSHRRGNRRDALGLRPRHMGGRSAGQHRLQLARRRLLVRRDGRAHLPAHGQRVPLRPGRRDRPAGRQLRRRRRDRRHPGASASDSAPRVPVDVGADRGRRRRGGRVGGLRRTALPVGAARRRAGLRRAHRRGAVGVPHDPAAGRVRQRDVGGRILARHRRRQRLGPAERRPRAGLRLRPDRHPHQRLVRRPPAGRQPVRREHRLPRRAHRRAGLALPVRAPRPVGLRRDRGPAAGRPGRRRTPDQGGRGRHQAGLHLRLRPRDGRAGLAHRGAPGSGGQRARRMVRPRPSRIRPSRPRSIGRG